MNMDQMNFLLWCLLAWLPIQFFLSALKTKLSRLPPGHFPIPVFGNLFQLGVNPHRVLAKLAQVHGPVMALRLGQVTTIVISSSAMAKEVLQKLDQTLSNGSVNDFATADDHHKLSVIWCLPL
ncbi:Lauric acid 10-hydroxylase-like protein [Drosera capensis]